MLLPLLRRPLLIISSRPPITRPMRDRVIPSTGSLGTMAFVAVEEVVATLPLTEAEEAMEEITRNSTLNNRESEQFPVGGRLARFKDQWNFDPWAFSVVSNGLGWRWSSPPPKLRTFFQQPTPFLEEYVQDLLQKKVIRSARSLKFQGRLFCVPKKDSTKQSHIGPVPTKPTCRSGST